jgi:hypothetical protein
MGIQYIGTERFPTVCSFAPKPTKARPEDGFISPVKRLCHFQEGGTSMLKCFSPKNRLMLAAIIVTGMWSSDGFAQNQVSIGASKDNTLYEDAGGSLSNGAGQHMFAGKTNLTTNGLLRRALVAFDVAGNVPAGATVVSVTLTLNVSQTVAGSQAVNVHRVLADWGEGTSTAPGNGGGGGAATSGDATWLHTFFNTSFWATAGGDFVSTPSAIRSVGGIGSYTWASTPALVSDVQRWLDSASSNHGWVLIGNEETMQTAKAFATKENFNAAARPRLDVTYDTGTDVGQDNLPPLAFSLDQNYPNPFNPTTTITYRIGSPAFVTLKVFDAAGQDIATLVSEQKAAGTYTATWNAAGLASGAYFYRLRARSQAGDIVQTRKLLLLR